MTADFRYLAYDLMSGAFTEEIPFESFRWSDPLNRQGGWSASMGGRDFKALRQHMEPGATAMYVDRNGVLLYGGVLWTAGLDGADSTDKLRVGGNGFISCYKSQRRILRSRVGMDYATTEAGGAVNPATEPTIDISWLAIDQFRIANDCFEHAATFAGNVGYDGIRFHGPGAGGISGVDVTRTIWAYESRGIADVVEELASQDTGFDYAENVEWNGTVPARYLDLYYPRRGLSSMTTQLYFELGEEIDLASYEMTAEQMANVAIVAGSGTGDSKVTAEESDTSLIYPTGQYPRYVTVENFSGVAEPDNLSALARAELAASKHVLERIKLKIQNERAGTQLGTFQTGDTAGVNGDLNWQPLNDFYRIQDTSIEIDENGQVNIEIELATEEATLGTS